MLSEQSSKTAEQLIGGGFEASMIRVLLDALDVQCQMFDQVAVNAKNQFRFYRRVMMATTVSPTSAASITTSTSRDNNNKNSGSSGGGFDFIREKARQTLLETVCLRAQGIAALLVEMPQANTAAIQEALAQRKEQAEREHSVHMMSRVDPRVVVPKSSTVVSASDKTLPVAVRVAAEKHALERFVIDYAKVYQQPTRAEEQRRSSSRTKKTKEGETNAGDSNNHDGGDADENHHDHSREQEEEEEGASATPPLNDDDGNPTVPPTVVVAPLEFDSASEASSNFDALSDGYDEDLMQFLQNEGDDSDDDNDDEGDDADEMIRQRFETRQRRKRRIQQRREFQHTQFRSSTVSHRVVHAPYFLARIVRSEKKEDDENSNDSSSFSDDEEHDDDDVGDEILLVNAANAKFQVVSKRRRQQQRDDDDDDGEGVDFELDDDDDDDDDGDHHHDHDDVGGGDDANDDNDDRHRRQHAVPLAHNRFHRLGRNTVLFWIVNLVGVGVAGSIAAARWAVRRSATTTASSK